MKDLFAIIDREVAVWQLLLGFLLVYVALHLPWRAIARRLTRRQPPLSVIKAAPMQELEQLDSMRSNSDIRRIQRALGHRPKPILPGDMIVRQAGPGIAECVYPVLAIHDDKVYTTQGCTFERWRITDHWRDHTFTLITEGM